MLRYKKKKKKNLSLLLKFRLLKYYNPIFPNLSKITNIQTQMEPIYIYIALLPASLQSKTGRVRSIFTFLEHFAPKIFLQLVRKTHFTLWMLAYVCYRRIHCFEDILGSKHCRQENHVDLTVLNDYQIEERKHDLRL